MVNKITTPPTTSELIGTVNEIIVGKQDTLTAGANIQITGNTISATDTTYTAGTGIDITNGVISNTQTSAEWGNIQGDISAQTDLQNALNNKADISDIPTKTSDLENDIGYITGITSSDVVSALGYTPYDSTNPNGYITNSALDGYATQNWVVNQNYITGDYIGDAVLTIQRNNTNIDTFTANAKVNKTINIAVPTTAAEVNALPDSTKYGYSIDLSLNNTDYKLTLMLKDQDGTILNSKTVDFPIESVVINGTYDSINKKIVLTLQNGNTIDIPVGDLIAGLQTEITSENKLDADLVDDSTSTSKFVTSNEKNTWNSKQDTINDLATIRSGAALGATAVQPSDLATVATSGNYNDLSNKPIIPAAQVNSDWNATSGVAQILNKPTIPTVPTNVSAFTNDAGYITSSALNGYATQAWVGQQGYITGITSSDVTTALDYTPYNASNPSGYITSSALTPYALSEDLASVATSGSYNDLSNKPTIPSEVTESTVSGWGFTKNTGTVTSVNNVSPVNGNVTLSIPTVPTNVSAFTNDAGYITSSALTPYVLSEDLATVATSGSYNDLSNKPTIPAAQVNSDWNATSGVAQILNKPTIPTVNNASLIIQKNGTNVATFTANASSNVTANISVPNTVSSVSSSSTNADAVGAKLFYDTVGDIETALHTINSGS